MQENETAAAAATETAVETPEETTETTATEETTETAASEETAETPAAETPQEPEEEEEITYHAVQKDNSVTAIWEMQGPKHLRTIDPRSREGQEILRLFTADEEAA